MSEPKPTVEELREIARQIRIDILKMTTAAGSGHPGGSLSVADILAVLYFHTLNLDPANPAWEERDRFILSKGHAVPALYSAMALRKFFSRDDLITLRRLKSPLQGHPDVRALPSMEASTGSLGQGLSIAIGVALGARLDNRKYRTFALIGDGESQEGQIWEAAQYASFHKIDSLIAFLDYNRFQLDDATDTILAVEPIGDRWRSFGWDVQEIDGHDVSQIVQAVEQALAVREKPSMIVANTIKGKGVSFMENNNSYHGAAAKMEHARKGLKELGADKEEIDRWEKQLVSMRSNS